MTVSKATGASFSGEEEEEEGEDDEAMSVSCVRKEVADELFLRQAERSLLGVATSIFFR